MKVSVPPSELPPNPLPSTPAAPLTAPIPQLVSSRRVWAKRGAGVAALALAAVAVWWWTKEPAMPDPPLPPDITDSEVRAAVGKSRGKVTDEPRSGAAWGEFGTVLLANLFDRDADFCFAEAAKLDPSEPRWPYARGLIALKRDPPNALGFLTAAADVAQAKPKFRQAMTLQLADALLERGEVERAAALFQQEVAPPDPARAHFGLGLVALVRGDEVAATGHFESARTHPCCRKQAGSQLALLARARGDVPASKQFEAEANALEADPPWPDPFLDRVVTLQVGARGLDRRTGLMERDGRYEEAAEEYLAQARHTRTCKLLTGAGVNRARLRQYDTAVELLREAVGLDPADPNARYTLALVLYTQAEKEWVRDPASPDAAKRFREVIASAKLATELKPDHALAYLFWGLSLNNLGEPKAAIDPLGKALAIRPGEFTAHLALGQALAASGDRAGAEASLSTAQRLKPADPRPAQELAKLKPSGG